MLEQIADLAKNASVLVMADEIYDQMVYDDAEFVPFATLIGRWHVCLTFSGLSKVYRACGYRVGWCVFGGDLEKARDYIHAMELLAASATVQQCTRASGQSKRRSADFKASLISFSLGGRLYQSRQCVIDRVNGSPYLSHARANGCHVCLHQACTTVLLARLDDQQFALELLENRHVLVAPGSSFNTSYSDHFRITTLPDPGYAPYRFRSHRRRAGPTRLTMFDWLRRAADDSTHVVTANRRLSRLLTDAFNADQLQAGRLAWRSPTIQSLPLWLATRLTSSTDTATHINRQQSLLLWERVLRDRVRNPLVNINNLARDSREAWETICEWRVPLNEVVAAAHGADEHVFADAALGYRSVLEDRGWIDDALLIESFIESIVRGNLALPRNILFVGFDRMSPALESLLSQLREQKTAVDVISSTVQDAMKLKAFDTQSAELRSAGAWAREELLQNPALRLAIVVPDLERRSQEAGRLIREGFAPGWQFHGESGRDAVNVSFGRRLAEYPAIETALLLLQWTFRPLEGRDVSVLLRSAFLGVTPLPGRARMELRLRKSPDRRWTIRQFLRAATGSDDSADRNDWLARISALAQALADRPRTATPSYWAEFIDSILGRANWPGQESLDSADYQLINRWRELLNELGRLELVAPEMSLQESIAILGAMASDTVFQPESGNGVVQVIGPLEAAGARFDRLWICGLTAARWPPPANPIALLSRQLQRRYRMPDADPRDTMEYAERVLKRLLGSADDCVCSFALFDGDAEQSPTSLLPNTSVEPGTGDPDWHASCLVNNGTVRPASDDTVPEVESSEIVRGGARTLQLQLTDPFAAFAYGRLGVRRIDIFSAGLSPLARGNLVHGALNALYHDLPNRTEIESWEATQLDRRIEDAVATALPQYERHADEVGRALLALERPRIEQLLRAVVDLDRGREPFGIDAVESTAEYRYGSLTLELRIDRIDRVGRDSIAIFDYKTGVPKRLVSTDGDLNDIQLAVYAEAMERLVVMLGIYNIDSRATAMDVCAATVSDDWEVLRRRWSGDVERAANQLVAGDIRVYRKAGLVDTRPLALLSRVAELRRAQS